MTSPQPTTRDLLARVRAREAAKARLDAETAVDLARYAALCAGVDDSPGGVLAEVLDVGEEDLAATLSWTAQQAKARIEEAVLLVTRTPATLGVLRGGGGDYARAVVVAEAVELLEPPQAVAVDVAVAPHLGSDTVVQLRRRVAREVLAVAPAAAAARHARGVRRRCVTVRHLADGLAQLVAHGPATDVLAAREALRRRALRITGRPGESRTRAAVEFDLMVASTVADEASRAAAAGPDSALVQVTVSLPTLLGLEEAPADLAGYGPITPADVRDLATRHGSRLRRLVTDPLTGVLVGVDGHTHPGVDPADLAAARTSAMATPARTHDTGSTGRDGHTMRGTPSAVPQRLSAAPTSEPSPGTPPAPSPHAAGADRSTIPAAVSRFVKARDRGCTVPWCHQPAARCDVDHRTAFPAGPTCPCNLHPLCRRHHRMKQRPGWTVSRDPDSGTTTLTTPTGTVRRRGQPPALPVAVTVPDPADLVDPPPDFWVDPRDDPDRRLAPCELTGLTDEDVEWLMTEPDLPQDPHTRPPPRTLEVTGLDADHRALRDAVRPTLVTETRPRPVDLGDPPF